MARNFMFETSASVGLCGDEKQYECRVTGIYEPGVRGTIYGSIPEPGEPPTFSAGLIEIRTDDGWHEAPDWLVKPLMDSIEAEGIWLAGQEDEYWLERRDEARAETLTHAAAE
jgi:hypothetical protein